MTASRTRQRLARILALVPWALANPYPTVTEVMERFGYASRRQLADDLNLLFCCGLPGYGPGDLMVAYMDGDEVVLDMADYFSRPLRLTPHEALGLLSAGLAVAGTSQGNEALARAVEKLTGALFPEAATVIAAELPPEPGHLDTLRRSARDGTVLTITYLSLSTNRTTVRAIEPLMVHASMGSWYLLAHCRLAGDRRLFRVDRIRSVEASGEVFEPPAMPPAPTNVDYTPSADAIYARLALRSGARWVAEYYPVEIMEDTGEELVIRFAMSDARVCARLLLRLGDQARLIEGPEVREETERLREAILARYHASRA